MPTISIQRFRASLVSGSDPGVVARTCRQLTRRPDLAAGMVHSEWNVWTPTPARAPGA